MIKPLETLTVPIQEWVGDYASDPDFLSWIRDRIRGRDPWSVVVVVGMLRLFNHPDPQSVASKVLAGIPDTIVARPLVWIRGLNINGIETVIDLCLAEIDLLHERIDSLSSDSADYVDDILEVCIRRDELAGVQILLLEEGYALRVNSALVVLDSHAEIKLESLKAEVGLPSFVGNGRLYRAYQCFGYGDQHWWLWLVQNSRR